MARDLDAQLQENAAAISRVGAEQDKLLAARNRLWAKALAGKMTAAQIGAIYGLEAQTIRWNAKRGEVGLRPKSSKEQARRARGSRKAASA